MGSLVRLLFVSQVRAHLDQSFIVQMWHWIHKIDVFFCIPWPKLNHIIAADGHSLTQKKYFDITYETEFL